MGSLVSDGGFSKQGGACRDCSTVRGETEAAGHLQHMAGGSLSSQLTGTGEEQEGTNGGLFGPGLEWHSLHLLTAQRRLFHRSPEATLAGGENAAHVSSHVASSDSVAVETEKRF